MISDSKTELDSLRRKTKRAMDILMLMTELGFLLLSFSEIFSLGKWNSHLRKVPERCLSLFCFSDFSLIIINQYKVNVISGALGGISLCENTIRPYYILALKSSLCSFQRDKYIMLLSHQH